MSGKSECNAEMVRRHEEMLISNQTILAEFIRRYQEDRRECADRYHLEREETLEWRTKFSQKIDDLNIFVAELKPNYRRLMAVAGAVFLGSIGVIFKLIWDRVTK